MIFFFQKKKKEIPLIPADGPDISPEPFMHL
jgi:hypothetical protein